MRLPPIKTAHAAMALLLLVVPFLLLIGRSGAQQLTNRSITIMNADPSASTAHSFQFTISSTDSLGSIAFEYCSNSPLASDPCTQPAGLSLNAANLAQQNGNLGFNRDDTDSTINRIVINRPAAPALATPSTYSFNGVVNPTTSNSTVYVRISTYGSTDGTGGIIDYGSVAFTTVTNFNVGAYIPPYLNLCVGVTVALDCSQSVGDSLDLGNLSSRAASSATSQLSAATNDPGGYSLYLLGNTLTSGNNVISALNTPDVSRPSVGQFGINLRSNADPPVGSDPQGSGTAVPTVYYNQPNKFAFISGDMLANSTQSTSYNLLTVSYLVNINDGQTPGVYATTITYLASAQF